MKGATHHLPPGLHCPNPNCKAVLDAHTNADGNSTPPRPGDLSICASCEQPLRFTSGSTFRVLTRKEANQLPRWVRRELERARRVLRVVKAMN